MSRTGHAGLARRTGHDAAEAINAHASAPAWQDILSDALRSIVIVVILERLYMTRSKYWLEDHLDYVCLQGTTFGNSALGFTDQIGIFWQNTRRLQPN